MENDKDFTKKDGILIQEIKPFKDEKLKIKIEFSEGE